jgi:hypothetical protein
MALRRYIATADSTITNSLKENLSSRATGSNMGASDSMEIFSIYDRDGLESSELSRILLKFPIDSIATDINSGVLSEDSQYVLRVFNAPHGQTLPRQYTLLAQAVSSSWVEGIGLDMESYLDTGDVTWVSASNGVAWDQPGGDYIGDIYSQYLDSGEEDIELDITSLVRDWISGSTENNGIGIRLSSSFETAEESYYTKKFFARGSEFFFKKPIIEARWDDSVLDRRNSFYVSSSNNPDNSNVVFFYNYIRGNLVNLPGNPSSVYVNLYDEPTDSVPLNLSVITGGQVSSGVYTASVELFTTSSLIYDKWFSENLESCYFTGSIVVRNSSEDNFEDDYIVQPRNFKPNYDSDEKARFSFVVRKKNWFPNSYTMVQRFNNRYESLDNLYFRIYRLADNYEVVSFGTGSVEYTKLSTYPSGNYFDLNVDMLEPGFKYAIQLGYSTMDNFKVCPQTYNFRVD